MNSTVENKIDNTYLFEVAPYNPVILDHGDGNWVYDVDNKKYLDLNSGQFCLSFGHNDKGLQEVVLNQLKKIYHTNTSTLTPEVFKACKDMADITGGSLTKTMFLSTGSEANECAFRYSRFLTGKNTIIALKNGYHGLTLGSQRLTMSGIWARPMNNEKEAFIESYEPKNVRSQMQEILREHENDVAAVIVEPVLGVGGIVVPDNEFFVELRKVCNENNIILIFDECQTGFGRTGEWFAYQKIGVEPDILVCAKAMGLGFAVSSVTFSKELAEKIEGKIIHFSSHQNDPLSCSIVSYVIKTVKEKNLLERNKTNGRYLLDRLNELARKCRLISNPRGNGLMLCFDLDDDIFKKYPDIYKKFQARMLEEGVLLQAVRRGQTYRLLPGYLITKEEIDFLINKLELVSSEIA